MNIHKITDKNYLLEGKDGKIRRKLYRKTNDRYEGAKERKAKR